MSPPAPTFQARRRNISTACTACQACKTKCNGARPQCSRCASRATPCTYQSSDDKRRLSVKTAVDAFVRRIACLEASIHAANLPLPSVSENDELIMRRAKQLHATKPDRHSPPAGPSAPASTTTRPAFPPTSDVSDSAGDNLADHASDIPRAAFFSGPDHGVMSAEDHDDEDDEGLLDDISNRMGDLHLMGDGQLRYYGATSNFNLISPLCSSFHEDIPLGQAPQVSRASLDEPMESTLEQHLEDLYFTCADPTFHVIDRRMYHDSKVLWASGQQSNTFYSPALTSAICAIGALFSHQHRQPKQFAEMFATRAKALLEADLNTPKVATVQALVVLSTFEAGATRDPRGWLYSGMAMRLAFDLGLHVDLTPMVQRGTLTVREEYARRTAFWGSYVVDHLWGFYLGRPFHVHAGNTTVKKPSGTHLEGASWHVDGAAQGSSAKDAGEEPSDHVELISYQWVLLCECMDALSNKLYGCSTVSQPDLVRVAEESLKSVQSWKQSLPSNLSIDLADESVCYLPHLYILHMQYYQILIYIHRPFISNQRVPKDSSTRIRLPHARRSCIEAALSVARLIKMYDTSHTLGRINIQAVSIIFSAALMLLYAKLSSFPPFPQSILAKHLEICSRSLAEIGKYYENASRSLDLLLSIKRDWQARVITGPLHGKVDKASPPVPPVAVANMTETSDGGSLNLNNDLADFTDFENSFTNGSAPFAGVDLHYFNDVSVWHGTFQEASPTNQYEIDPSSNWMVLDGLSGF